MKPKLTLSHTYKEGDYVPSKEDLIALINKKEVTIAIIKQAKYDNDQEKLTVTITHP